MTHITMNLCPEARTRLDAIPEPLKAPKPRGENGVQLEKALCTEENRPENDAQSAETFEPEETQPKEEEPTQPEIENDSTVPEVTEEDIRSKYMSLSTTPKKPEAAAIIKQYAAKISAIPADKRAEVLERLTALEG